MKLIDHDFTIRPVRHGFRFGLCVAACGVLAITLPSRGTAQEALETPSGASSDAQVDQPPSGASGTTQAPLSASGPRVGPALFQQDDRSAFVNAVRDELNYLAQAEPDTHTDFLVGIARMVTMKSYDVDEDRIRRGDFSVDPFSQLDPSSEETLGRLHDAVSDRLENGVTVESIVAMGKAHQDNAVIRYKNAVERIIRTAEKRREDVATKQQRMESILARMAVLDPELHDNGNGAVLKLQLINGNQFPVASVEVEIAARGANRSGQSYGRVSNSDLAVKRLDIDLSEPILPGERRAIPALPVDGEAGFNVGEGETRPVVASVTRLTGPSGGVVTGAEYAEASKVLDDVITAYRNAARSIERRMNERIDSLRNRLDDERQ